LRSEVADKESAGVVSGRQDERSIVESEETFPLRT
jgi:hypothetical protein